MSEIHLKYIILNTTSLAVKKCQKVTKASDIKEGQEDKTFVFLYCNRNDILQGSFTTMIDFVTWPPLQVMMDSTKRWPSGKVNYSCDNSLEEDELLYVTISAKTDHVRAW